MAAAVETILTEVAARAWALPEKITVSEWADANRILDQRTAAEPGEWRTARTPYLREIMDCADDSWCEEVTFKKSTQVGGTEAIYNVIGWSIDQDPAPTMLVMPREEDAKTTSANRLRPMIELSPALAQQLPRLSDDIKALEYRLERMTLYFAGANSPSALASKPVRRLFFDETNKYPKFSGVEADPIELGRERTRTFWNRQIWKISTPTTPDGYITREYERSDRRRYQCQCQHCGGWQPLVWGQVRYPEGVGADEVRENRLADYECSQCQRRLSDEEIKRMVQRGKWVPDGHDAAEWTEEKNKALKSRHRGYWINCLYSPWLTLHEIAAKWIESYRYTEKLMNFVNSWLGEEWRETVVVTDAAALADRIMADNPMGLVPVESLVMTAGIDVQRDHFYYCVDAWGYDEDNWNILYGRVETWLQLDEALFNSAFPFAQAPGKPREPMRVRLAAIDARHRTDEVYKWARRIGPSLVRVVMGEQGADGMPSYRTSPVDKHPVSGQALPGSLRRWLLNTTFYKNKIARMMSAGPGTPGQMWLAAETDEDYLNQMCSEEKVLERNKKTGEVKEYWTKKAGGRANHYLDCKVYSCFSADMLRVWGMRRPDEAVKTFRPAAAQAVQVAPGVERQVPTERRSGFVKTSGGFVRGGGWMRK